jgi:hypothetical protein
LLARRVTDSHERQAAVELLALRQELARLGFTAKKQLKEVLADGHRLKEKPLEDSQAIRQHRQFRQVRATRLSPAQRLANLIEDVRRWIDEVLA